MSNTEIWQLSASETAVKTRSGEISASEAVEAALDRMTKVNPSLNAVVADLNEEARTRAKALDASRANGKALGPLFGVPLTIKVNVDQKGWATTNGVSAFKDNIAPANAPIVDSLERAGAVVIGRTNTPEFSFRADTDNPLHGRTHNPWGRHISAGGSSGGAGSAVMAGIGALAHGNDIGGSLRFPAAASGAVTIKSGLSRVPAYNPSQKVERGLLAQSMSVQGLITRCAADLHLAMPTIIQGDPRDPFHAPLPWRGPEPEGPIRVAFTKDSFGYELHPEVDAALETARDALIEAGYQVEEAAPPDVFEIGRTGYLAIISEVHALLHKDIDAYGSATIQQIFDFYFEFFGRIDGTDLLEAMAKRTAYARAWSEFQTRYPLVLCPFQLRPYFAPDRDTEGTEGADEVLGSAFYSYAFNYLGLPAGCVPARLASLAKGPQPIPVQVIGPRWREDLVVDAMAAIEAQVGCMCTSLWHHMDDG